MDTKETLYEKLETILGSGIRKIAIYPYGKKGREIENILKKEFHIEEIVLFDKEADNENVLSPDKVYEYSDYFFLVATVNKNVKAEVISLLLSKGISDKHIFKIFEYSDIFLDDRKNRAIDEALMYELRKYKGIQCKQINTKKTSKWSQVIVTLTSFPARIKHIRPTIESLLVQSYMPSQIILWLAREEFPEGMEEVPKEVRELQNGIFSIKWCHNIRSYKKLVPALQEFSSDIIVTADDDLIYDREWLLRLYKTHLEFPNDIICHRITKMIKDKEGRWADIPGGWEYYSGASYLNKLTGGSGTLYPPNALALEITNEKMFMGLAPTSDDIWFWLMGVYNNTKIRAAKDCIAYLNVNSNMRETPALSKENDSGEKLFWVHFYNILYMYPEIADKLEQEYHSCADI